MLTLFDYLPSQNGWKVRQLLQHLAIPYQTEIVSIFEGQGQTADYLAVNPLGRGAGPFVLRMVTCSRNPTLSCGI